jgi:hypothetical protein
MCRSGACLLSVCWRCRGPPPVPVLSPWLPVRRLRQPRWRWSWCLVPGCSVSAAAPTSSRAARRPGEVSAPGLAVLGRCAGWLPRLWLGCGGLPGCRFPRSRSILQHTGAGASPSNTSNKLSQPPPRRDQPWNPVQTRCRRCRTAPGIAGGSRGGPSRRPCLPGTDASAAPASAACFCAGVCGPVRSPPRLPRSS